ncbi:MAG: DsbA family protein [Hyphomicrobiaceae bacterium]
MMRFARRSGGLRLALTAAVMAIAAGAGATLLAAGESLRLAQAAPPSTGTAAPAPFDEKQRSAIEAIVKDYLLKHPEVMLEVQTALEEKMEKIQAEKLKTALAANASEIFRDPAAPVAGNPAGDIPVVEFFDYNCGYCRRAFSDVSKLVEADPKVKLVLKELPILSKGSEEASRVALAARQQDKYWPVHRALIGLRGEVNERSALRAVEKLGLDMDKLKKDMNSEAVSAEIQRVRELARKMGIQGTPHFLVGDRAIPGAPGNLLEQMKGHIAELRKTGCPVC